MRLRFALVAALAFALVAACSAPGPRGADAVPVTPIGPAAGAWQPPQQPPQPYPQPPSPSPPQSRACAAGEVADSITHACIVACGRPPESPQHPKILPTCTTVSLRDGRIDHEQLTMQLSSGATTRIDCPRMRFRGQDTPLCVLKEVGGRLRGGCCPPGHTDPTDPECTDEGSVDDMYKRQKAWEWCKKGALPTRACEVCVWYPGAER